MFNLLKTLFHESGHFFAMECHNKKDNRFDSKNIKIYELSNYKYNGDYNPNISPEIVSDSILVCEIASKTQISAAIVPLERLSYFLLRMINGCVFESIFCKNSYDVCFNENSNGKDDFRAFMFQTEYHNIKAATILQKINNYKFELEESNILKKLFTVSLEETCKVNKFNHKQYDIDLDYLRKHFDIDLYYKIYQKAIKELEDIILS